MLQPYDENINLGERELEYLAQEEDKIRTSQWYADECTKVKDITNGWMDVTNGVQNKVIVDFLKKSNKIVDENMINFVKYYLRKAPSMYPNNTIFQNLVHVKYNRARLGNLNINDIAPNCIMNKLTNGTNFVVLSSIT